MPSAMQGIVGSEKSAESGGQLVRHHGKVPKHDIITYN